MFGYLTLTPATAERRVCVIEEAGFEALPAGSVPEALALVEDHDPDAAILDVDLAGHGTAVACLAVGDVIGVATGADWIAGIACSEGGCPLSGVVHAMQFMLAPTTLDERDPRPETTS
jgi:Ethanolamine utilization protein EutJ (predicted chaperonin)